MASGELRGVLGGGGGVSNQSIFRKKNFLPICLRVTWGGPWRWKGGQQSINFHKPFFFLPMASEGTQGGPGRLWGLRLCSSWLLLLLLLLLAPPAPPDSSSPPLVKKNNTIILLLAPPPPPESIGRKNIFSEN